MIRSLGFAELDADGGIVVCGSCHRLLGKISEVPDHRGGTLRRLILPPGYKFFGTIRADGSMDGVYQVNAYGRRRAARGEWPVDRHKAWGRRDGRMVQFHNWYIVDPPARVQCPHPRCGKVNAVEARELRLTSREP